MVVESMSGLYVDPRDPTDRAELLKAIRAKDFAQLPAELRYPSLMAASLIVRQMGHDKQAQDLAVRGTAIDIADYRGWAVRAQTAFTVHDFADAGQSVTVVATRWPNQLGSIEPELIWRIQHHLQLAGQTDTDYKMLKALFNAGWKPYNVEPNHLWQHLALLHLERNEKQRAAIVASRITSARTVLSMRVDKRFDPLISQDPKAFNVDHLVTTQIKMAQARVEAHPNQLRPIADLQSLYLATAQYARVLAVSNAAVAATRTGKAKETYSDFDDQYNWILDARSRAFEAQGYWEKAVLTEVLAARHLEDSGINVSQRINLAMLYASLKQPHKAARALAGLTLMTPYGHMQLEMVKLQIAVEKNDASAAKASMGYLRKHRDDAIGTWQRALLYRGNLNAAARLLIERLENPSLRNAALVSMQHYIENNATPVEQLIQSRWNIVAARPDVQAAVRKVGRLERFNLTEPMR